MPKLSHKLPSYRLHKASGQAVVTLDGTVFYLGLHGSEASRVEYDRLIQQWMRNGRRLPRTATGTPVDITVNEILLAFMSHAEDYYRKNGKPSSELNALDIAIQPLRRLYGDAEAQTFGPLALEVVRDEMIGLDW